MKLDAKALALAVAAVPAAGYLSITVTYNPFPSALAVVVEASHPGAAR